MKVKILYSLLLVLLTCSFGFAQTTFTSTASGNWSNPATWIETGTDDTDGIPDADDIVVISVNHTVTLNANAACVSITFPDNVSSDFKTELNLATYQLNVSGNITLPRASNPLEQNILNVAAGILSVGQNIILSSGGSTVRSTITISTGIVNIAGNVSYALGSGGIAIEFTGDGILNITGDFLPTGNITLTPNFGTIHFNGTDPQSIRSFTYHNIKLSGGPKTFSTPTVTISNRLNINSGVIADLGSGGTHIAKSMVLGSELKASGTWGSTPSSSSNKNDIYFTANTGIITVGVACNGGTKTWDGSTWSGGTPTLNDHIEFAGDYDSSTDLLSGNKLSGCSCTVTSGNVIFDSGHTLEITNQVAVNGGSLTFNDTASLIQYTDTPNSGNITYIRHSTPLYKYDYTFWSSPVTVGGTGMTLAEFSPETIPPTIELSGFQSFYDDKWSYTLGTTVMEPGVGYAVMAPANHVASYLPYVAGDAFEDEDKFVGTFTGVPNNGPISVPVIGLWQLVGNPYPSSIDTDTFIEANPNLYGTFYFWTHATRPSSIGNNYSSADYASFNNTGGVSTDPDQITPPAIGSIGAGQGFFIGAYSSDPIVFTNAMRAGGNNSQFFKLNKKNKEANEKNRIWLNLTNEEGLFKQILIGYVSGATNSYDRLYDGVSFSNNKYANFYSINNGTKLSIQGRALPFADTEEIPLGFNVKLGKKPAQSSQFTISISSADGDLETQPVYLYDKVTNNTYDLRQNAYSFPSADGTFLDRFVLKFTNKTLGTDNFENTNEELIIAVKNKAVTVNTKAQRIEKIVIYDITGKAIFTKDKIGNSTVEITSLKASNQVLLVKVSLENGFTTTKKIILN